MWYGGLAGQIRPWESLSHPRETEALFASPVQQASDNLLDDSIFHFPPSSINNDDRVGQFVIQDQRHLLFLSLTARRIC